jgi:C-terminal processing protease CtpA/Prc
VLEEPEAPAPPRRTIRDRIRALLGHVRTLLRRIGTLRLGTPRQRRLALASMAAILLLAGAAYAVADSLSGSSTTTTTVATGSGPWLGINVTSSAQGGVMVVDVFPGSPAQAAGMEPGDVITRLNGKPVFAPSDVTSVIAAMHPGQQVKIQYQGSGVSYTSSVPLATRPAGYP